ncbi:cytochrome oxidase complex assembly protein 1-domain-containing protein [Podospora aff. communis PSN243]|uniref:Cytochrome oxidase complex assembly protein 1-domain-containing protein n=1 Tax=Podospora aff. communis PSN243 TaxID=3040156 RepID=A0AAV9H6B9_9PEZI|nr:cytochrome oxidase complex assembly protein 1-domain-containing protein [Podospora aff. communis PSN243]
MLTQISLLPRRGARLTLLRLPRKHTHIQTRTLIPAPKPNSGPLLERRSDRALPDVTTRSHWRRTLPLFGACLIVASIAIFNYQKLSSPVTAGTLYALRMSPKAREVLGDNIYFDAQIPWISGGMNQVQGKIDISFKVKGTKGTGTMRFVSHRPTPRGVFETTEWTLETSEGRKIDLLEEGDPFKAMVGLAEEDDEVEVRGYRQMNK